MASDPIDSLLLLLLLYRAHHENGQGPIHPKALMATDGKIEKSKDMREEQNEE